MREVEFLPSWYPQLRRRKRLVVLQAYMTLVVAGGLGLWMFMAHRNVQAAEASLRDLGGQVSRTDSDLAKLEELLELQKQWGLQDQIVTKLGLHVGAARMFNTLDSVMPPQMSLLDLKFETVESAVTTTSLAAARDHQQQQVDNTVNRRLNVKLVAVTPGDEDVANFLAKLTSIPFFDQVAMTYSRDRIEAERAMREFEVTFSLNLNAPGSN